MREKEKRRENVIAAVGTEERFFYVINKLKKKGIATADTKERKFPIKDRKKKKYAERFLDQTISEQYKIVTK